MGLASPETFGFYIEFAELDRVSLLFLPGLAMDSLLEGTGMGLP